ncbi:MAG: glycosyltransferase family 2 protein [Saprospiraceae bacterium]|nr:glycosyltransferase family 2 protein [Saprospiraceae bacterium]
MNNDIELSIVIPCFNSEKTIINLIESIVDEIALVIRDFEIILVNDCSVDGTLSKIRLLSKKHSQVIGIDLMYNVGQFRALLCGLSICKGNYIVTMDDDLQHSPRDILPLYENLKEKQHLDAIIGKYKEKRHNIFRNLGSYFLNLMSERIFNKPKDLYMSSFRCLNRKLVDTILENRTIYPVIGPLILQSTKRIENIEISHEKRKEGHTNYTIRKLFSSAFDSMINFSSLPLKVVGSIGFIMFISSMLLTGFYLIQYLLGCLRLPGWTTLVILINFYFGIVLFTIGIIGEYLDRIIQEVKGKPKFVIREQIKEEK